MASLRRVPGAAETSPVQHVMSRLTGAGTRPPPAEARSCWLCSLPLVMSMVAVALLLGRSAPESGRLCHRDGGPEGGDRRRKVLMLAILPGSAAPALHREGSGRAQAVTPLGEGRGGGYPVRTPVIDLVEVGAGGGSEAWIDAGGALRVGPRSAGARPGLFALGLHNPPSRTFLLCVDIAGSSSPSDGTGASMWRSAPARGDDGCRAAPIEGGPSSGRRAVGQAQNGVDSRSGILQTPKELVESPFPAPKPNLEGDVLLLDPKNSYPFSVVDTSTDRLLGILPSNGGHHDCVIIPTRVEQMKHTRPARFDRARLTGRSLTAWDGCRLPCDLERPGL